MVEAAEVPTERVAFTDESFSEHGSAGFYVLAAAVVEPAAYEDVRQAMRGLLRHFRGRKAAAKLHWNQLEARQQQHAVQHVVALGGFHVVTVGSPVSPRRQERARALCLRRLVVELHGLGVRRLCLEAREPVLNRRDVRTVAGARFLLPKGSEFRVDHEFGLREPLLWVADLVAGAARAHRLGDPACWYLLADCVHEIEVNTDR